CRKVVLETIPAPTLSTVCGAVGKTAPFLYRWYAKNTSPFMHVRKNKVQKGLILWKNRKKHGTK
ncbi:hypothetical protein, partial [Enterocloster sp.]|uniref:hypothetical protein n=1 Tax=Enterocloster sp. TaxID=2719315 RepID=UPI0039A2BD35